MSNESRGPQSRQEFEREVVLRAVNDREFRRAVIADPRAALRQAFGVEVPPDVELRVLEETPTSLYLVLPPAADELSEEELARVAGGAGSFGDHLCAATLTAGTVRMR